MNWEVGSYRFAIGDWRLTIGDWAMPIRERRFLKLNW
jgi:hypothetical protein